MRNSNIDLRFKGARNVYPVNTEPQEAVEERSNKEKRICCIAMYRDMAEVEIFGLYGIIQRKQMESQR